MNYLFDTCLLINLINGKKEEISSHVQSLLQNPSSKMSLSTVSLWEMAIKYSIDKLALKEEPGPWLLEMAKEMGWTILDINAHHIFKVSQLPHHHNDPFDRLLVAQSQIEKIPLITPDKKFKKYDMKAIW